MPSATPRHAMTFVAPAGRVGGVGRDDGPMSASDLPRIGAPATRALAAIGITRLDQVADRSEAELLALHGVGPRAIRILREALDQHGRSLRP